MIVDEAHAAKESRSELWERLKFVHPKRLLLMSATLYCNKPVEIWNLRMLCDKESTLSFTKKTFSKEIGAKLLSNIDKNKSAQAG